MAITYTGAGGVFTRLGKIIKNYNLLDAIENNIRITYPDEILDEFNDAREYVKNLLIQMEGHAGSIVSAKSSLIPYAETLLIEQLKAELGVLTDSIDDILNALYDRMVTDNADVEANMYTVAAPSAGGSNVGDGELIVSDVDGDGRTLENLFVETVTVKCTSDAQVSGTEGQETFGLKGGVPLDSIHHYGTRQSGGGSSITVMNDTSQDLDNSEFEDFTANVPDDWTIVTGTAGTHINENATNEHSGVNCLEFAGDGALAAIEIKQALTGIEPNTVYVFGVWINTDSVTQGTVELVMKGTGWTTGGKISIGAAWPTSYAFYSFFTETPRDVPSDVAMHIKVSGTLNAGASVWFDRCALSKAVFSNNLYWGLFRGATDFVIGDIFTTGITDDNIGVFADWIARVWDKQLPSVTDSSETIADTLAI